MVYNPVEEDNRSVLKIMLSEDDGQTWKYSKTIDEEPNQIFTFPTIRESDFDNRIHISYTLTVQGY